VTTPRALLLWQSHEFSISSHANREHRVVHLTIHDLVSAGLSAAVLTFFLAFRQVYNSPASSNVRYEMKIVPAASSSKVSAFGW
jgi:hypothetical protein